MLLITNKSLFVASSWFLLYLLNFFEIYRQFGHAPSERFAGPDYAVTHALTFSPPQQMLLAVKDVVDQRRLKFHATDNVQSRPQYQVSLKTRLCKDPHVFSVTGHTTHFLETIRKKVEQYPVTVTRYVLFVDFQKFITSLL